MVIDGVIDTEDAFPLDSTETLDSDDDDGFIDSEDAFPLDADGQITMEQEMTQMMTMHPLSILLKP